MTISPDGSDVTKRFIVRDSAGAALTHRNVYDYAVLTYPIGQTLTDFDGLSVYRYQIARLGNDTHGFAWVLDVEYRSLSFGALDPLPWNDDPEWSIEARTFEREFYKDATTPVPKRVQNSVGDQFDPLPTTLAVECEMRYTRNENPQGTRYPLVRTQVISQSDREVYCNTDQYTIARINGAAGFVVPARRSVMWIESVRRMNRNGVAYVEVTYGFRFYPLVAADEVKVANVGYFYYTTASTPSSKAPVEYAADASRVPAALNLNGTLDTSGNDPLEITFKRPVKLVAFSDWSFT